MVRKKDNNYKHRRSIENRRFAQAQLNRIYIRDDGICWICLEFVERCDASRDHIREIANNDSAKTLRDDSNVRLAHIICNNDRSNKRKKKKIRTSRLTYVRQTRLTYEIGEYFSL